LNLAVEAVEGAGAAEPDPDVQGMVEGAASVLGDDVRSRASSAFLQKPFGSAELIRVVREILGA